MVPAYVSEIILPPPEHDETGVPRKFVGTGVADVEADGRIELHQRDQVRRARCLGCFGGPLARRKRSGAEGPGAHRDRAISRTVAVAPATWPNRRCETSAFDDGRLA